MYIDDLGKEIGNSVVTNLFADDVYLHAVSGGKDGHWELLSGVGNSEVWVNRWRVVWCTSKTVWMLVGGRGIGTDDCAEPRLYGVDLARVSEFKYLGVWLAENRR